MKCCAIISRGGRCMLDAVLEGKCLMHYNLEKRK